jgi:hypothetical protein
MTGTPEEITHKMEERFEKIEEGLEKITPKEK